MNCLNSAVTIFALYITTLYYYLWMWCVSPFSHLSICVSVCPVCALTFESLRIFLVCRYIVRISRSCSYIKIIGSKSRSKSVCLCCSRSDFDCFDKRLHACLATTSSQYLGQGQVSRSWCHTQGHKSVTKYRVGQKPDCFLKVCNSHICWHRITFYLPSC